MKTLWNIASAIVIGAFGLFAFAWSVAVVVTVAIFPLWFLVQLF